LSLPGWVDGNVSKSNNIGETSNTAQVHPYLFTNALVDSAKTKGAVVKIGCVQGFEVVDDQVKGVIVDGEVMLADAVVIAMGPWTKYALKYLGIDNVNFFSYRAHSITMRPTTQITPHALFLNYSDIDGKAYEPEVYPRPDGQVYVCGMSDNHELPEDPNDVTPNENSIQKLKSITNSIISTLSECEIEHKQVCYLPTPEDSKPILGKISNFQNAYIATGHTCWGILNSLVTGLLMSELILDGNTSIDISKFSMGYPNRFFKRNLKELYVD